MSAAGTTTPLFDRAVLDALPVEHLCDLSIDLEPAQMISTPLGTRMTFVTKGGRFTGPGFRGEMLPGGGDWVWLGTDGISRMDVRATLRTHDGVLIHYESNGVLRFPPDGRLPAGLRSLQLLRRLCRCLPRAGVPAFRFACRDTALDPARGNRRGLPHP